MINAMASVPLEIDLNLWTIITFVCNDQEKQLHFLRDHECFLGKVSYTTGKGQLHEARLLRVISPDPFFPSTAPHSLFEAFHTRCHLWKRSATWSSPSKGDLASLVLSLHNSPVSLRLSVHAFICEMIPAPLLSSVNPAAWRLTRAKTNTLSPRYTNKFSTQAPSQRREWLRQRRAREQLLTEELCMPMPSK